MIWALPMKGNQQTQPRCLAKQNNHLQSNHTTHISDACSVSLTSSSQSTVYQDITNERSSKKRKGDSNISFSDNVKSAPVSTHECESPVVRPKNSQGLNTSHPSIRKFTWHSKLQN